MSQSQFTSRRNLLKGAPAALAAVTGAALLQQPAEASGYAEPKTLLTPEHRGQIQGAHDLMCEHFHRSLEAGDVVKDSAFIDEYIAATEPLRALMHRLAAEVRAAMPVNSQQSGRDHGVEGFAQEAIGSLLATEFAKQWQMTQAEKKAISTL